MEVKEFYDIIKEGKRLCVYRNGYTRELPYNELNIAIGKANILSRGSTEVKETVFKIVDLDTKRVIYNYLDGDTLIGSEHKSALEIVIEEALKKLTVTKGPIELEPTGNILFIGTEEEGFNIIPRYYQGERNRSCLSRKNFFYKELKVEFNDGQNVIFQFTPFVRNTYLDKRFDAVIAPNFTIDEFRKANKKVSIIANYYLTKGD